MRFRPEPLHWIDLGAPRLLAGDDATSRPMAARIAAGSLDPRSLTTAAGAARCLAGRAGRVESAGQFTEAPAHDDLVEWLGPALGPRLRAQFEWYVCRGAFFHNDAHYPDVLFGIWYIDGPAVDLVFPRAGLRLNLGVGNAVVFDPFEIHGVLHPGEVRWVPDRYADAEPSIFAGFEIALDPTVEDLAGIRPTPTVGSLSSRTRISATTGEIS